MSKTYHKCRCGKHYSFQPCPQRGKTGAKAGKGKYGINDYKKMIKKERGEYE